MHLGFVSWIHDSPIQTHLISLVFSVALRFLVLVFQHTTVDGRNSHRSSYGEYPSFGKGFLYPRWCRITSINSTVTGDPTNKNGTVIHHCMSLLN